MRLFSRWLVTTAIVCATLCAPLAARPAMAAAIAPVACAAPFASSDRLGPVFRDTRMAIADTEAGTVFSLSGCLQSNAAAGEFHAFLINALIFDRSGNLLVAGTAETAPVPSGNPASEQTVQPWAMAPGAGYKVAHEQVRPSLLLIVYSRGCPDGTPANCTKPYDTGPDYLLLSPCVTDTGMVALGTEAACPSVAPPPPPPARALPAPALPARAPTPATETAAPARQTSDVAPAPASPIGPAQGGSSSVEWGPVDLSPAGPSPAGPSPGGPTETTVFVAPPARTPPPRRPRAHPAPRPATQAAPAAKTIGPAANGARG